MNKAVKFDSLVLILLGKKTGRAMRLPAVMRFLRCLRCSDKASACAFG